MKCKKCNVEVANDVVALTKHLASQQHGNKQVRAIYYEQVDAVIGKLISSAGGRKDTSAGDSE